MNEINWQNFKCRCSAINMMLSNSQGNAPLTELQVKEIADLEVRETKTPNQQVKLTELILKRENSKKVILSDTCIGFLMEHYSWVTQGMVSITKEMDIEQFQKGRITEQECLLLLSIVDETIYEKNEERVYNDFLSGIPDVYLGPEIMQATKIFDTKSSWDYPGFLKKINTPVTIANERQIQGYCDITGAGEGYIADCLVNMPQSIVNDYKRRLLYKMDTVTDQDPAYLEALEVLMNSMHFEKIPRHQRVFKKKVGRFSDFERQKVYDKVKVCRDWLEIFHEMYIKLNN
jgi:hypothetical protein